MTIEKSSDSAAFTSFEHEGWENVSDGYDQYFSPLTKQSIPSLLDSVDARSGMSLLDVCTGPGVIVQEAVKRGAQVTGIDFSAAAIDIARRNVPEAQFLEGDALNLPMPDNSFDAVVCGFGLIHLPDPEQALQEMQRVLKPSGKVAVSVWAEPAADTGFGLLYAAIKVHADLNIPLPHGPDFFQFSSGNKLADALRDAGFKGTSQQQVEQIWELDDSLGIIRGVMQGTVRARGLLMAQSESVRQTIFDGIEATMQSFKESDGIYQIPTPALVGVGRKSNDS